MDALLGILALTRANMKFGNFTKYAQATGIDKTDEGRATRNVFLYGLGYNAAGIGCAGPLLAGVVLVGLSTGGAGWALLGFLVYGLVMASLMFLLSNLARNPEGRVLAALRNNTARVKNFAGAFQVLVGIFLIATAIYSDTFERILLP